ncbi:hypothetical protein cyc_08783 [Cyclospora cayetanensis]|uniref:Uncharacterized protein n=1 Tax=Cyclospora cayetanensis TaxID=88456 RepID=A0A1D3D1J1_9EIME|nr:hypothetical protein cyc_08783 [Cyclospora cayetanensis]
MSTAKATPSSPAHGDTCSFASQQPARPASAENTMAKYCSGGSVVTVTLESKVLEAWQRRIEQQKELKQKLLKQAKKSARCREELERRAVELRNRIEAREKQAYALRCEHLQRIRRKCVATAERSSMASTVTSEDRRSKGAT